MHGLLFLLLFNFGLTSVISDHLPVINITVKKYNDGIPHTEIPHNCCVIDFNEAFKVMVYLPSQFKRKIECYKSNNLKLKTLSENLSKDGGGYSVIIKKANAFMAAKWKCTFYSLTNITTRPFEVHVRGKRPGILYINNNIVTSYPTNYTILGYDMVAYHHYIDGEMTPFKCESYKYLSSPKILFQNKVTDERLEIVDNKQAVLYLRLTKEYNKSYLDCKLIEKEKDGIITNTIRVFFMETTLDIPKFKINEMVLTPVTPSSAEYNSTNPNGTFVYEYYDHENIIIRTLTGNNSLLWCNIGKAPSQTVNGIKLNVTLNKDHDNLKITCAMKDNKQHNDVVMTLKLIHVDFYPMSGLSWANVLAKYKNGNGDIVIQYLYRGNTLLLTCYALDDQIQWKFNESQMLSKNVSHGNIVSNGQFWDTKLFEMKPTYKRCNIKCYEDIKPGTIIELVRDGPRQFADIPEIDIMEYINPIRNNDVESSVASKTHTSTESRNKPNDGVTSTVFPTSTPNRISMSEDKEKVAPTSTPYDGMLSPNEDKYEGSFFKKNLKLLLICTAVIVAITVIAVTICLIMKRLKQKRKEQADSSNINYENIPEHSDGPMPIPPQWQSNDDDITYSIPDHGKSIDNLYAKPLPKDLRSSDKAPIYSEAYDYSNRSGADYVNTGSFIKRKAKAGNDNSDYSEVYQNNKVEKYNDELKYANIDQLNETYAQVEPKTLRDCDNVGILKENCYGNLNITDNQAPNNYSEAAYADINN